ncbi:hypothetical protein AGABI2DRAFT_178791 [Agaricus bisporus var. bisporus H97]|uniref:hypothetical protein n=1 Tax=Agaricus bisporus var. bisporus (strain H97 / ATCC MYA-4626 / FGSC 10389) TaxID=936046 RepID=UPI00029F58A4|nr:hypothetical protein AGABI2DRAFT_178791 [Agaricus bisporus var. bisporus H97]EKV46439.1 hypothetical protein AGABI2DRAFT_178791 [Agaricus bisporus var. bisporus H97]
MTYGQLPSAPVVLVFESSEGKANKHLQDLGSDNFKFYSLIEEFKQEMGTMTTTVWEMRCELDGTKNELKETKNELKETKNELKETKNELKETKNELKGAKETIERQGKELNGAKKTIKRQEKRIGYLDKAIERQEKTIVSLKEEHQKDHKFHAYLHLRALLDQSCKKIAHEFGMEKWNAFVRENGNQCSAMIYSRFSNSLTLECIDFLCDDQSVVRLRGNVIAHHEETDKMQQAITDDDVVEDDRKHLLMLFDFISQEMAN